MHSLIALVFVSQTPVLLFTLQYLYGLYAWEAGHRWGIRYIFPCLPSEMS